MRFGLSRCMAAALLLFSLAPVAWSGDYRVNGYLSLVAGKVVDSQERYTEYSSRFDCPCYVADWNQGSMYEEDDRLSFKPESRGGLLLNWGITRDLSFSGEMTIRAHDQEASLESAYFGYSFTPSLSLQVGRKRLPYYYYSEYQDIGHAYVFIRPSGELYGWEIANYNGANLRYQGSWNAWAVVGDLFGGYELSRNNEYTHLYDDTNEQDVKWKNIVGGTVEASRRWFTARAVYFESDNYITDNAVSRHEFGKPVKQKVAGIAFNADFESIFFLTEYNVNSRKRSDTGTHLHSPSFQVGVGGRIGSLTPYLSYTSFRDRSKDDAAYAPEYHRQKSVAVRYDLTPKMDIKLQLDKSCEDSEFNFYGDTTLLSASLDLVF